MARLVVVPDRVVVLNTERAFSDPALYRTSMWNLLVAVSNSAAI